MLIAAGPMSPWGFCTNNYYPQVAGGAATSGNSSARCGCFPTRGVAAALTANGTIIEVAAAGDGLLHPGRQDRKIRSRPAQYFDPQRLPVGGQTIVFFGLNSLAGVPRRLPHIRRQVWVSSRESVKALDGLNVSRQPDWQGLIDNSAPRRDCRISL